jgi:exopolysaccharide biosynthesis predicted pyruvyltransferase EpsI
LEKRDAEKLKSNIVQGMWSWDQDASILDTNEGQNRSMSRVVLSWREHKSYRKALKRYPFVNNIIVPDIAFQLGPYAPMPPNEDDIPLLDIVVLLRDDKESTYMPQRNKQAINEILSLIDGGDKISFSIVDWEDRLKRFNGHFSPTLRSTCHGSLVICDRLHRHSVYLSQLCLGHPSTGRSARLSVALIAGWM